MSDVGSVASAPQSVAGASHGKVQAAQKAEGRAAVELVEATEKTSQEVNSDPARGQNVDLSA
jgi:hypothetical protein